MQDRKKFIVTAALPYANGPLHIGHLAGCYLPSDIYTRFRRMQGHDVHYLCGSDEHGVAISFLARREGTTPQAIVDRYHERLKSDLERAGIELDVYSRTTHPCHAVRTQDVFLNLERAGLIEKKTEQRLYCSSCEEFLPDRYVVGECPVCHSPGARGDQCEKCGSWYEPESLINPICQICKQTSASLQETSHWYLRLNVLEERLTKWLETKVGWRKNVLGYAFQPIKAELTPRAITRDLDWGIPLPLPDTEGKVFYVWFDAPIGYISASEDWSIRSGEPERWRGYWEDPDTTLVHFIGKDNIVFHTVVWPAILMGDGRYVLPELVAGNEFLNLEGEKISTSRNYAIWVGEILDRVERDLLRYYLTRISPETADANFTWSDFQTRINSELADILGNLINRNLSFLNRYYEGRLVGRGAPEVLTQIESTLTTYSAHLEGGFSKLALESVLDMGRFLNGYLQERAPWTVRKTDPDAALEILSSVALGIKAVAILLAPICPDIAQRMWEQLGLAGRIGECSLRECTAPFAEGHTIAATISPLVHKIEDAWIAEEREKLSAVLAASKNVS